MMTLGDIMGLKTEQETAFDASKPHLIRFDIDSSGNVSSVINNRKVYREKSSECEISAGDCWLCSLTYSVKGNNYFARGLRLVDAEDLIRDDRNLVDELAEYMLDFAPATVQRVCMPRMESKVEEMLAERMKEESSRISSEYLAQIGELNDELDRARDANTKLEAELEDREATIEGLETTMRLLRDRMTELEQEVEVARNSRPALPTFAVDISTDGITRVSEDTLCSRMFADGRYRVRFNINGRRMTITEHPDGDTVCRNNTIRVPNLERIIPFDGIVTMIHRDVPGGVAISLI